MFARGKLGSTLRKLACAILFATMALPAATLLQPQVTGTAFAQAGPPPQISGQAGPEAVQDDVRATLSQFGSFVQDQLYGEVWIPSVTPQGWHPYEACHWVNTQKYGWYYDDDTPWGAIIHHYGRWMHTDQIGWFWVPGNEFSPGWVVWRTSPEWIGWAPMLPDEAIKRISADEFNNGGFWTFMKVQNFNSGCTGSSVAPAQRIPVLLQETQYVTELEYVEGIAIIVLPPYIWGEYVEIDISFDPWPIWFYTQIVLDWTWVWNTIDVVVTYVYVDCNPPPPPPPPPPPLIPGKPPAPPLPPPPPPLCSNGEPRLADGLCPVHVRPCPDGSLPDANFRCLPPPMYCPLGTHPTSLGCINDPRPCPDGTMPGPSGLCYLPPPRCPPGEHLSGQGCVPNTPPCPPGTMLGPVPGVCIPYPNPTCPPGVYCRQCPDGSTAGPNGCPKPPVQCPPGTISRNNECVPVNTPICPPGMVPSSAGCINVTPQCPPGTVRGPNGCTNPAPACPPGSIMTSLGCKQTGGPLPVCPPGQVMTNSGCHAPIGACPVGQIMGLRGCVPVFTPTPVPTLPLPVPKPTFPGKPPIFGNPGVGIGNLPPGGITANPNGPPRFPGAGTLSPVNPRPSNLGNIPSGPVFTPQKFPVLNLPPRPANKPPFVLAPGGGGNNLGSNNPKPVGAAPFRAPPPAIFHPMPAFQDGSPLIH